MYYRHTRTLSILLAITLVFLAYPFSPRVMADTEADMSGTYILYNPYANTYAEPANATTFQGNAVKHHPYNGLTTQMWEITRIPGTDKYLIMVNDYCMATAAGGTDVYLQVTYPTTDSYSFQQWYLDPIEMMNGRFGKFKIRTASSLNENKVLTVQGNAAYTQLRLNTYTNDTNYSDEWYLCPVDEAVANVILNYDSGYRARFANHESRVSEYMKQLQCKYITEFGIWINYLDAAYLSTWADQCPAGINERCSCGTCTDSTPTQLYNTHHTNIRNIAYRLPIPSSQYVRILFIGRYTCDATHQYDEIAVYGVCYSARRNALITAWNTTIEKERSTTVHEFGHFKTLMTSPENGSLTFGLDHYGTSTSSNNGFCSYTTSKLQELYPNDGYSDNCIYGIYKSNVNIINNITICNGCKKRIIECRNQYGTTTAQ